jgi:hypothetical protein
MGHHAEVTEAAAPRRIWIVRRTWPDRPQTRTRGFLLGRDEHGSWIGLPGGHDVFRGDTVLYTGPHPVVTCIPDDAWWTATWFGRTVELVVDVVTPARWSEGDVTVVDLDYGILLKDGEARLVDAERFEEHRLLYEYPSTVESAARAAAAALLAQVAAGEPPFTADAAAGWFAVLRAVVERAPNGGGSGG